MPTLERSAYIYQDIQPVIVNEGPVQRDALESTTVERSFQRQGKIVQYDVAFDTNEYAKLLPLKKTDSLAFEEKKKALDGFVKFNLDTAIGERFNAGLSQRRDEIIDGEIVDTNMHRSMLDMIKKGVEYRRKNGSTPSDQLREQSEVTGFTKIQAILASRFTPVGTMMVSVSPPGEGDSIYKHNFYDVFTLKESEKGRYIDVRRFSSGLTLGEYKEKIKQIRPDYFETEEEKKSFTPKDFLANPFEVADIDADTLHKLLHKDHRNMEHAEYQEIIRLCQPFIHAYLDQLAKNPYDMYERNVRFNAILNKADEIADQRRNGAIEYDVFIGGTIDDEIYRLGEQEVREVATGCGASGGANTESGESVISSLLSPFSVGEFGLDSDRYGPLEFPCPYKATCGKVNRRPRNTLIENCQHCGKSVRC